MIPPMETKAPRVMDRHVTHGTRPSSKEELRRFFSLSEAVDEGGKGGVVTCSGFGVLLLVKGFFIVAMTIERLYRVMVFSQYRGLIEDCRRRK
jgi:hypothetical protein